MASTAQLARGPAAKSLTVDSRFPGEITSRRGIQKYVGGNRQGKLILRYPVLRNFLRFGDDFALKYVCVVQTTLLAHGVHGAAVEAQLA